ncbi:Cyanophycinase precursor [compost metagenome]
MASQMLAAALAALSLVTLAIATPLANGEPARRAGTPGAILLAGGALQDGNQDLWAALYRHVREASGKERPRVAVFGSARPSLAKAREAFEQDGPDSLSYGSLFRRYGFDPVFVPVAIDNYRDAASSPRNVSLVDSADAVWFGGGNQDFHARSLLNDDGSDSLVMQAVRRLHARGGLVGGTSAGAAVMDEFTYGEGSSRDYLSENALAFKPLTALAPPIAQPQRKLSGAYTRGFGFVTPLDAAVDTHTDARGRYGRLMVAMRVLDYQRGVAVAEDTALLIQEGRGTVHGAGRVLIADARQATYPAGGPFQVTGLLLNSLAASDAYDFDSGAVISSKPVLAAPLGRPAALIPDILERDHLLDAMENLVASSEETLSAEMVLPQGKLVLTLAKSPATRAFHDPAIRRFAVQGVAASLRASRR